PVHQRPTSSPKRVRPTEPAGRTRIERIGLSDLDVLAVRDLEDVVLDVRDVAVAGERDRIAQDRRLQARLGRRRPYGGSADLALAPADRGDRGRVDLGRDEVRRAEGARGAGEPLVEGGDDARVLRNGRHVRSEERDVAPVRLELRRV